MEDRRLLHRSTCPFDRKRDKCALGSPRRDSRDRAVGKKQSVRFQKSLFITTFTKRNALREPREKSVTFSHYKMICKSSLPRRMPATKRSAKHVLGFALTLSSVISHLTVLRQPVALLREVANTGRIVLLRSHSNGGLIELSKGFPQQIKRPPSTVESPPA